MRRRQSVTRSSGVFSPDSSHSMHCRNMPICALLSHMKAVFCLLLAATLPVCAQVKITQHSDRISIEIDGKPFSDLFVSAQVHKPYMYPLRAATGTIVTRAFPMDMVEGESRDHPHQRGLWFSHGDVYGWDFWANEASQVDGKKGKIVLKKIGDIKNGKKSGTLLTTFDWIDPSGKTILTETRTNVFYFEPHHAHHGFRY